MRAAALFTPPHCHADAHVVIRRAANHLSTCRMRLHAPMTVSSLRVAGNCVGDDGATALAAALKENATLTTLNLGCACRGTFHPATLPRLMPATKPENPLERGRWAGEKSRVRESVVAPMDEWREET